MNKHQAHHYFRYTRRFRWQYLLLAAGVAGIVCLLALRSNSQQMAIRRDAVFAADRDNGDVQGALQELQLYVTNHLNTNLTIGNTGVYPPIQLQYTYQRLLQAKQGNNGDLYTRAQAFCQAQNPSDFSGRNRVPCIQKFVAENGAPSSSGAGVSDSLYKFNFVSPTWSPDLAGWSMAAAALLGIAAAVQFAIQRWFKRHQ